MKSILKLLLVCYLLLALPFQAFAAASMRLPAALAQTAPVAKQLPPCHQQMAMEHEQGPSAKSALAGEHQADQHAKDKCGTCAACCVGAAMATSLPAPLALAPPSTISIPFHAGHLPSVDPVLPERPPSILPA